MPIILPRVVFLYPENTQVINVFGLADETTGTYLDAATVFATLYDPRGNADPVLNAIPLTYLAATNGNYQGTVPASFNPPGFAGEDLAGYLLKITAEQAGAEALYTFPAIVKVRSQQ